MSKSLFRPDWTAWRVYKAVGALDDFRTSFFRDKDAVARMYPT